MIVDFVGRGELLMTVQTSRRVGPSTSGRLEASNIGDLDLRWDCKNLYVKRISVGVSINPTSISVLVRSEEISSWIMLKNISTLMRPSNMVYLVSFGVRNFCLYLLVQRWGLQALRVNVVVECIYGSKIHLIIIFNHKFFPATATTV